MTIRCLAKINLDLRVGPRRADGFHPIDSWFVTVGLYDTLTFEPANEMSLTCDDPTIPADARNLVWRAAAALRPVGGPGMAIRLAKQIPSAAGLGGGSSNAATTLVALNEFWQLGLSKDHLHALAATLGSDVPFFLHGPSSVCTGRGDVVTPVPPPACGWAVLILPNIKMPTPEVFRRLDELRGTGFGKPDDGPPGRRQEPGSDLCRGELARLFDGSQKGEQARRYTKTLVPSATGALDLLPQLVNDLERPAFDLSPALATLRDDIERRLGRPVRMSGSGATLFTLYDDQGDATAAAAGLSDLSDCVARVAEIGPKVDTF